jgi:hypothetical protein
VSSARSPTSGIFGLGIDPEPVGEPVVIREEAGDLDDVVDRRVAEAGGAQGLVIEALQEAGGFSRRDGADSGHGGGDSPAARDLLRAGR